MYVCTDAMRLLLSDYFSCALVTGCGDRRTRRHDTRHASIDADATLHVLDARHLYSPETTYYGHINNFACLSKSELVWDWRQEWTLQLQAISTIYHQYRSRIVGTVVLQTILKLMTIIIKRIPVI